MKNYSGPPPAQPDLIVANITTDPVSPTVSVPFTLTVTVRNQRTADASSPFRVDWYLDPPSTPSPGEHGDGHWDLPSLAAGVETPLTTRPTITTAGEHALYTQVDTDGAISESNETNNVLGPLTVRVESADTEGPLIETPTFDPTVASDEELLVTASISDASTGNHGVSSATLYYGYTSPYDDYSVPGTGPGGNGDGTWTFSIAAQGDSNEGSTLKFSIEACDNDASPACATNDNSGSYYSVLISDDDTSPPAFFNNVPLSAANTQTITLQVDISDPSGIYDTASNTSSVYLEWDTDGELVEDVTGSIDMDITSGDTYEADTPIGPFEEGTLVSWRVWAEDNDNSREVAWSDTYTVTITGNTVEVCGTINEDIVWSSDFIYIVTCDSSVASGVSLTVEPGTVVKFDYRRGLTVNGTLVADGTQSGPITFTANTDTPTPGYWDGITFAGTSIGSFLDRVNIGYGGYGSNANLRCNGAPLTLSNSTVHHSSNTGIYGGGAGTSLSISNSTISNNTGNGISIGSVDSASITGPATINSASPSLMALPSSVAIPSLTTVPGVCTVTT